jgi:ATP/ADP translocase
VPTMQAIRIFAAWSSFALGTLVLLFAILLTQTPSKEHTFDLIVLLMAASLLLAALLLGRLGKRTTGVASFGPAGMIMTGVLILELLVCLYGILSIVTYRSH